MKSYAMKKRENRLAGLCLSVGLILGFGHASNAATLFPNRARGWQRVPTIVIAGNRQDARVQLVIGAVNFWNQQLSEIGSSFRLGPLTFSKEHISADELAERSEAVLARERAPEPTPVLMRIDGDLIVALSDGDFVSFTGPFLSDGRRLIGIRGYHLRPLTLPNVARNIIAHEFGHAIGLGHNDDPKTLMCGRPAPCRPDAFRSDVDRYFPLLGEEKEFLLKLYPPTWK